MSTVQTGLDVVGLTPMLGTATSLVNATISAARGDWGGAGLNAVSAIPSDAWAVAPPRSHRVASTPPISPARLPPE